MFGRRYETAEAINNLAAAILQLAKKSNEKVEKLIMGLREDFDTLTTRFDGMESAVILMADDVAAFKREIEEANARANIDLSPLIARAEGLEARMRATAGPQAGSDPVVPPVEPPVEPSA